MSWWILSKQEKKILQQQRLGGRFGGQNAAGVRRAPYFWAQEGYDIQASQKAEINPHFAVDTALGQFSVDIAGIMRDAF